MLASSVLKEGALETAGKMACLSVPGSTDEVLLVGSCEQKGGWMSKLLRKVKDDRMKVSAETVRIRYASVAVPGEQQLSPTLTD